MVLSTEDGRSPAKGHGGYGLAWSVIATLLAGMLAYGGIGWGLDALFGTRFIRAIGALLGFAGAIYLIMVKYGRPGDQGGSRPKADVPPGNDDTEDRG